MKLFAYLKAKRLARKRKRTAIRMLAYSGVLRHANVSIRYALSEKELSLLLKEEDLS